MATIRDIAKAAGVSVGTASRAITGNGYVSEENRTLVMQAAENLGYTPKERKKNIHQYKDRWCNFARCNVSVLWFVFEICGGRTCAARIQNSSL